MYGGARGAAAYLLDAGPRCKVVVDMGGDTPLALAQVGLKAGSADVLLISHLHPDHVSGLPAFLWSEMTAERAKPLIIVGPPGNRDFPSVTEFLRRCFGPRGAFAGLQDILEGKPFSLSVIGHQPLICAGDITITWMRVSHGRCPALAFRVESTSSVVFAGDQNGLDSSFAKFAKNADTLILHAMLADASDAALGQIVASPEALSAVVAAVNPKRVLLSHLMDSPHASDQRWSLRSISAIRDIIAVRFPGELLTASDGMSVTL
jgi:ribonuclease Z